VVAVLRQAQDDTPELVRKALILVTCSRLCRAKCLTPTRLAGILNVGAGPRRACMIEPRMAAILARLERRHRTGTHGSILA
jgi:hypothetical protein